MEGEREKGRNEFMSLFLEPLNRLKQVCFNDGFESSFSIQTSWILRRFEIVTPGFFLILFFMQTNRDTKVTWLKTCGYGNSSFGEDLNCPVVTYSLPSLVKSLSLSHPCSPYPTYFSLPCLEVNFETIFCKLLFIFIIHKNSYFLHARPFFTNFFSSSSPPLFLAIPPYPSFSLRVVVVYSSYRTEVGKTVLYNEF